MKKTFIVFTLTLVAIGIGVGGIELAGEAYFYPDIPKPDYPFPGNRSEAWAPDFMTIKTDCYEFPNCYWLDFFFNVSVGALSPEINIPFTFKDYISGQDATINFIIETHSDSQVLSTRQSHKLNTNK